jgi:oligopeptide/dipeptide ABC transporter ATP-binding protein
MDEDVIPGHRPDPTPGHRPDPVIPGHRPVVIPGHRPDPVLSIEDVHVTFAGRYGVVRAVDGVSLDVRRGEVVALVGESGCGKTTLLRSLLGLEPIAAGRVSFEGRPVEYAGRPLRRLRRRVQMIFQDPTGALNPRHTVYEAVAEGIRIHGVAGDEAALVAAALARAGLRPPERFVGRYPHEISGGQRQRVLIAGAIALSPALLLADEPVASLDASIRGEILALLRSLVDETGLSIVAVTHDLGMAWNIADRIAVMYLGRVVELGGAEEVLQAPQHPYTKALLSVVPEKHRVEPQILTGEIPDPSAIPAGCRFHPRCPLLLSGEAAARGVADRCTAVAVELLDHGDGHLAACHAL